MDGCWRNSSKPDCFKSCGLEKEAPGIISGKADRINSPFHDPFVVPSRKNAEGLFE